MGMPNSTSAGNGKIDFFFPSITSDQCFAVVSFFGLSGGTILLIYIKIWNRIYTRFSTPFIFKGANEYIKSVQQGTQGDKGNKRFLFSFIRLCPCALVSSLEHTTREDNYEKNCQFSILSSYFDRLSRMLLLCNIKNQSQISLWRANR